MEWGQVILAGGRQGLEVAEGHPAEPSTASLRLGRQPLPDTSLPAQAPQPIFGALHLNRLLPFQTQSHYFSSEGHGEQVQELLPPDLSYEDRGHVCSSSAFCLPLILRRTCKTLSKNIEQFIPPHPPSHHASLLILNFFLSIGNRVSDTFIPDCD